VKEAMDGYGMRRVIVLVVTMMMIMVVVIEADDELPPSSLHPHGHLLSYSDIYIKRPFCYVFCALKCIEILGTETYKDSFKLCVKFMCHDGLA
jgi:hypothetical protein